MSLPACAADRRAADRPVAARPFTLARDAFGRLQLTDAAGTAPVTPVRAFPLAAPDEAVSLVGPDGRERAWVDSLADLAAGDRALVLEDLGHREFMPEILRLVDVSTFATPSAWTLETDRGPARLLLKSEDDLRRLPGNGLLVASGDGVHYRIRDRFALDKASRKLLDRFL
ncbi:DUF1854 domain-containing protein [uncultured Xylophilus sp.]|uniref:cyanophycin metabolism-associated DUF1854 family protein n=1 Tax=uncultured Xylophilus sp. TaxID=296832 RepID=UPI0025E8AC32|nr:DUF1854 domain-containing protein [uncultured Xylophilus sp.]